MTERTESLMASSTSLWMEPRFNITPDVAALKLLEEAQEVVDEPIDIKEMADILIVLFNCLGSNGYTWQQLLDATETKVQVNLERDWVQQADGTWRHTKKAS